MKNLASLLAFSILAGISAKFLASNMRGYGRTFSLNPSYLYRANDAIKTFNLKGGS
jgi:hypothetical protein